MTARASLGLVLVVAACSDPSSPARASLNLERPVDVSFACYGGLRITDGNPATPDQLVTTSAMPQTACDIRSLVKDDANPTNIIPPGQGTLGLGNDPTVVQGYAFILQSVPGTVGIARFPNQPSDKYMGGEVVVIDSDPLTPGKNGITVGSLPVAIATDEAGCHVATANAGSCDLTIFDVGSILGTVPAPVVNRVEVTNAAGETILAKPAAMLAEPAEPDPAAIGFACPAAPTGLFYVAYPNCHIVAAIDGTGRIVQHVQFAMDGTATVVDNGTVSCPAECGDMRMPPTSTQPHPVTLDLVVDRRVNVDTRRLAIGAEDLSAVTIVELDAQNRFLTASQIPLADNVGVVDIALSPQIGMGGQTGREDVGSPGGQFQFAYAVATDGTVRVADVLTLRRECDTQIDPRYIHDVANIATLSCLPFADPTRPRRPGARGPGIELLGDSVPTAVTIFGGDRVDNETGSPARLVGYFAAIATTSGQVAIANVDDDLYADIEDAVAPVAVHLPLAIAHQLRDAIPNRGALAQRNDENGVPVPLCNTNFPPFEDPSTDSSGPRLAADPARFLNTAFIGQTKGYSLPGIRQLFCMGDDESRPVSELGWFAPPLERELAYPDLHALRKDETWTLVWEGSLSRDSDDSDVDGPPIRLGLARVDGSGMRLEDASHPYCSLGVEAHDIVQMRGCDPSTGDAQCPTGFTCYVHPDAQVSSGSCLPADQVDSLSGPCRDFLISVRRYAVQSATSGVLRIAERPRVLRTTPLTGCVDANQCTTLARVEANLISDEQPGLEPEPEQRMWACARDTSRNPVDGTGNRCVMTCDPAGDGSDCDLGSVCNATGVCVEGEVPPAQCVTAVQRYELRAGDAFTVVGTVHGYQHPLIEDMATGACVRDPAASPLMVGRIPLTAPPCVGSLMTDILPNPCRMTTDHTYRKPRFVAGTCDLADPDNEIVTDVVTAIRFRNPQFTFHLVNPTYQGDLMCKGDRLGSLGEIPTTFPGLTIEMRQVDGLFPKTLQVPATFPVRVVKGPQNSLWVIDEGDFLSSSSSQSSTRGKVFRVEAGAIGTINTLQ